MFNKKLARIVTNPEIIYGLLLLSVFYVQPNFLKTMASTFLGKVVFVLFVILSGMMYGNNVGLISAFIVVLLLHSYHEGFENGEENVENENDRVGKEGEVEGENDEEGEGETEGEGEGETEGEEETNNVTQGGNDLITQEEMMKPTNSKEVDIANMDMDKAKEGDLEPVDSTKNIESFSNYY
jgi:hypothetical protein